MKVKKILAVVLSCAMVFSSLNITAYATSNTVQVSSFDELKTAINNANDGDTITLNADIERPRKGSVGSRDYDFEPKVSLTFDLNNHTLTMWDENLFSHDVTFKNGNIVIKGQANTGFIWMYDSDNDKNTSAIGDPNDEDHDSPVLYLNNVNLSADDATGFAIIYTAINGAEIVDSTITITDMDNNITDKTEASVIYAQGSSVKMKNTTIKAENVARGLVLGTYEVSDNSKLVMTNNSKTALRSVSGIFTDTTVTITGCDYGIENDGGQELSFEGTSTVSITDSVSADVLLSNNSVVTTTENTSFFYEKTYIAEGSSIPEPDTETLEGLGTEESPYLINNIDELKWFRDDVNAGNTYDDKYIKLTADIDLNNENWTPIGDTKETTYESDKSYKPTDDAKIFRGVFDGNGYKISNLKIEKDLQIDANSDANLGLFGLTGEGAVIKNLTITNVTINTGGRNVGALAGIAYKSTFDNITVNGKISITGGNNVSGVCAISRYYDISATNITVSGEADSIISGNNIVGGIFAEIAPSNSIQIFNNLTVENVAIKGVGGVGGIVGLLTKGSISGVTVKNVELVGKTTWKENEGRIRIGSVAGLLGGTYATVANVNVENVTAKNLEYEDVELPVVGANYDAEYNATEAKVGDKYYAKLQFAVNEADVGDTVTILANVALSDGIVIGQDDEIILELNGKVISRNTEEIISTAAIINNGCLTIQDAVGNGKITAFAQNPDTAGVPYYANNTITNCGKLTVNGGTIENSTSDDARAAFPIDNNSTSRDAVLNITGGTITGRGAIRQFANSTSYKNVVNITGGFVTGTSYGIWVQNPGTNDPKAELNISDGNVAKVLISPSSEFDVKISGGSITEVAIWNPDSNDTSRNPSGFITGGTFSYDVSDYCEDGFVCEKNSDGTYGVVESVEEEPSIFGVMPFNIINMKPDENGNLYVGFFAGIDALNYKSVGFELFYGGKAEENKIHDINTTTVYESVSTVNQSGGKTTVIPKVFGDNINYIYGKVIGFDSSWDNTQIIYRSYAVGKDGKRIYDGKYWSIDDIYDIDENTSNNEEEQNEH